MAALLFGWQTGFGRLNGGWQLTLIETDEKRGLGQNHKRLSRLRQRARGLLILDGRWRGFKPANFHRISGAPCHVMVRYGTISSSCILYPY